MSLCVYLSSLLCSAFKWLQQQLAVDSLCQNISPQHCQRFTPESRGQSKSLPVFLFILQVSRLLFSSITSYVSCTVETLFSSHHRLWSQNSLPAETLPRTRKPGRRLLSTTATHSTPTPPTTPSRCTHLISTKREWNQNPVFTCQPLLRDNYWRCNVITYILVRGVYWMPWVCYYGNRLWNVKSVMWWMTKQDEISETSVHFFCPQQDWDGHIPCIDSG